jgi:hypothetical protein
MPVLLFVQWLSLDGVDGNVSSRCEGTEKALEG